VTTALILLALGIGCAVEFALFTFMLGSTI